MDYKTLYIKMLKASEEAIRILESAQRECEELYVESSGSDEAPEE